MALGIMPLLGGLYGYCVIVPELERAEESAMEAAEEHGLDGIPGISADDNLVRVFTFMIMAGGSMTVIGAVLLTVALYGKSGCAEERPEGRNARERLFNRHAHRYTEETVMNCGGCGRPVSGDWEFCEYCGHSIRGKEKPVQSQPPAKSGISTTTIIIIVVVVIVVIPIVLSAMLYYMVLGFGSSSFTTPSAFYMEGSGSVTNGMEIEIVVITSSDVPWDDIRVWLTDGTYFAEWSPLTRDLDDGSWTSVNLTSGGPTALGDIDVYCIVSDISGNGYVNGGDYIQVFTATGATAFSPTTTYRLVLIYEPTSEQIGMPMPFTG